jgi:hypothetical protein
MNNQESLVFTLPVHKRPDKTTYYGQIGFGIGTKTGPICRVETTGEVYLLEGATLVDVRMVLAGFPYNLEFEELKGIKYT